MRRLIIRFTTIFGVLLVLLLGSTLIYWFGKKPTRTGTLTLPKLDQPVDVLFDQWGIPHIYGQSEGDAVHALGYLQAQDRLFQIDLIRRVGSGRLAELFGKDAVKTDRFFRTLGIKEFSKEYLTKIRKNPNNRMLPLLRQYLAGVNEFIRSGPTPIEYNVLGVEPQPLVEEDIGHLIGYMAFSFAKAIKTDSVVNYVFNNLGKAYVDDLLLISIDENHQEHPLLLPKLNALAKFASQLDTLLPTGLFHGSNSWVISGSKTSNGLPILANDPHIGFSLPDVWYEAHIHTPTYEIYGHHLAGSPLPQIGFNRHFAWGITMFENDDMDFYRERLNPDNPNEVRYKGKWVPLQIREEVIQVKGEDPETLIIKTTPHGPIINDVIEFHSGTDEPPISMFWTFVDPQNTTLQSFYEMTHATSFEEFRKGVSLLWAPGLNILYADTNNTIAQWGAARIPIRPDHVNPLLLLDGASGKDDSLGYHPFETNPAIVNPQDGILLSANNVYEDHDGPYVHGYYVPKERSERLTTLLRTPEKQWTAQEVQAVQLDTQKSFPLKVLPTLLAAIEDPDENFQNLESAKLAENALAGWKGHYLKEDIAPTIWERFYYFGLQEVYGDKLPDDLYKSFLKTHLVEDSFLKLIRNPHSPWWKKTRSSIGSQQNVIRISWKKAIDSLVNQFGTNVSDWKWGRIHTLEFRHPFYRATKAARILNVGPFPMNGTKETINHLGFSIKETEAKMTGGPSVRRIIPLGNLQNAHAVSPLGQSGNPADEHYRDQTNLYINGEYRRQLIFRKDIEANLSSTLRFVPDNR